MNDVAASPAGMLGLLFDLEEAMANHRACEHSQHEENRQTHWGDAQWCVSAICPYCPYNVTKDFCDPFVKFITAEGACVRCADCGQRGLAADYYTSVERIKGA